MVVSTVQRTSGDRSYLAVGLAFAVVLASVIDNTVLHPLDSDMSWLLIVAERMMAGDQLYVDVWEANPPFSVFLYLPAAWLAQVTDIKAELLVVFSAYLWAAGCLTFAGVIVRRIGEVCKWLLPATLALVLLSLPQTFAQREYFGILAALPMLAVAMTRLTDKHLPLAMVVGAGALASVTMMVKPHYALAFFLPYLYLALRKRSWLLLFAPEVITAAIVVIAYGILVALAFPAFYSDVVPVVLDVYVWRRWNPLFVMLNSPGILIIPFAAVYGFLFVRLRGKGSHVIPALASLGFFIAFMAMGKGFPYQALPFIVTGGMAVAMAAASFFADAGQDHDHRRLARYGLIGLVILIGVSSIKAFPRNPTAPGIRAEIETLPPNPAVAVIASNITIGHPFTRLVDGRWRGRDCSDWLGAYALERLSWDVGAQDVRALVDDAVARKRTEIVAGKPDILIINRFDAPWVDRVMLDQTISKELRNYALIGREGAVEYFQRR